ncbi:MAG TPA: F0F1 ATP synthase subunit epsilon [Levilinea sp.]|nr:F0F1 ATP synthase subunit epsilon [Levilinea sp.]
MNLKVLLPTEVLVNEPVAKVHAEAFNGHFCLEPNHIDFVAALVPSLLIFEDAAGAEKLVAVDEGILVKVGPNVTVSTQHAVRGTDLGSLHHVIEANFKEIHGRETATRCAMAQLEAELMRRLKESKL